MLVWDRRKCSARVVEAKCCGGFRNRRRLVPRAPRNRIPSPLAPDHGPARQPSRSVRQSIARFPPIPAGGNSGHSDVCGHMHWYRSAPALMGHCYSISNRRSGHPEQDRAISLSEAAALQSLPDPYRLFGTATEIAQPVGNAVPVRLAQCLGGHLQFIPIRERALRAAEGRNAGTRRSPPRRRVCRKACSTASGT